MTLRHLDEHRLTRYQNYGGDCFLSSDHQKVQLEFIKHEIHENEFIHLKLKAIFYHACRGGANYHAQDEEDSQRLILNRKDEMQSVEGYSVQSKIWEEEKKIQKICLIINMS